MSKISVGVIMGGKSPEHEISLLTGKGVVENLDKNKYQATPIVLPKDTFPKKLEPNHDIFFIAMHGPFGEDGTIQGMLDLIGARYTGSGVLASAIGMNKDIFKKIISYHNIPQPQSSILNKDENLSIKTINQFGPPWVIKPANQGSSVGVSIVKSKKEINKAIDKALNYSQRIIIEEFIKGIEVSCGIIGNKNPQALPLIEIRPKNSFFDYQSKYTPGVCEEIVPAEINDRIKNKVQKAALKVYQAINCQDFGRVDIIIRDNQPYVLEINTIPGLTPTSLLPQEAAAVNINYSQLVNKIVEFALVRQNYQNIVS